MNHYRPLRSLLAPAALGAMLLLNGAVLAQTAQVLEEAARGERLRPSTVRNHPTVRGAPWCCGAPARSGRPRRRPMTPRPAF